MVVWCIDGELSVVMLGTPLAVRFSTVGGESGSADTVRDPRGFAVKLYTEVCGQQCDYMVLSAWLDIIDAWLSGLVVKSELVGE